MRYLVSIVFYAFALILGAAIVSAVTGQPTSEKTIAGIYWALIGWTTCYLTIKKD